MDASRKGRDEARRAWPWALEDDAARTIRSRRPAEDWLRHTAARRGSERPRRLLLVADDGTSRPVDAPVYAHDEPPVPHHASPAHPTAARRTIQVRSGVAAERHRRRPPRTMHDRAIAGGPDRAMLWAVLVGVFVVLVAAASAHAAPGIGDRVQTPETHMGLHH